MQHFLDQYGYIALFIGSFFEGETAILIASSLVHTGIFYIPWTILVAFSGSFLSDWIYYMIGRLNGKYFIERRPKLKERVKPVQHFFLRHKAQILFSYRFLYGFRVIIPLVIGMSGLKPIQFLVYSLMSGLIWASTVSSIGFLLGEFLEIETNFFEQNIGYLILCFAAFGLLLGYIMKRIAVKELQEEGSN